MYTHFTLAERYRLETLLSHGYDQDDIADSLGRSASSVTRELFRNPKLDGSYSAQHAHKLARIRRKRSKLGSRKIETNSTLQSALETRLHPLCSPEVLTHDEDIPLCHQTIYSWIERSRPDLTNLLPYHGKKRRKYGTKRSVKQGWTNKVRDIDQRPEKVEAREELGHWEGDTVHGLVGNLLTYTERVSRYETAILIERRTCDEVHLQTKQYFQSNPAVTITYDRGSEFSLWKMIEKDTKAIVYFAKPHHPWQRGSNENANGRLRRVFPKRFDFSTVNQEDVNAVVWRMNHTKRKVLSWRTPCVVYGYCCTSS